MLTVKQNLNQGFEFSKMSTQCEDENMYDTDSEGEDNVSMKNVAELKLVPKSHLNCDETLSTESDLLNTKLLTESLDYYYDISLMKKAVRL